MKRAFVIHSSSDGIGNIAFSNIKALYNFLLNEWRNIRTIDTMEGGEISFNYPNIVKEIRSNQALNRLYVCIVEDNNGNTINVLELGIQSK